MKKTALTLFLLASLHSFCQQTLDDSLAATACSCLSQVKSPNFEDFGNCLQQVIQSDSAFIRNQMGAKYCDTCDGFGVWLGKELYARVSVAMVYSCPAYFKMMDELRSGSFDDLNHDSLSYEIQMLSKTLTIDRDDDFYTHKGIDYFLLGDMGNALINFDQALKIRGTALRSLYFKAWCQEIQKNYDAAYELYTKVAELTGKNEYKVFAAMVEQKKKLQLRP